MELEELLGVNGIEVAGVRGTGPRANPIVLLSGLLRIWTGSLRGAKAGGVFGMHETDDLSFSYVGWALKRNGSPKEAIQFKDVTLERKRYRHPDVKLSEMLRPGAGS